VRVSPDLFGRLRCRLALDVDDANIGPFRGEALGDRPADSLAASGNDGNLSLKSHFLPPPAACDPILND
jgi:hypothetical protein